MKNLTSQQIVYFKQLFLQRQQNILLSHLKDDEIDVEGGDDIDLVQGLMLKNILNSLSQRDIDSLNRIKAALFRIEASTFGTCEDCDEPIPERRLLALPDCKMCISCAEERERLRKQYAVGVYS